MVHELTLPITGYIRIKDVLKVIPVGRSTWWQGVRTGKFPQPVKLGPRTTAWRTEDIRRLIEDPTSFTLKEVTAP